MEPKTLIRVITWLPVGGIERRLVSVVPRLREFGWNPRVVCIREEGPLAGQLRDAGIPVDVIPFTSRLSPKCLMRLAAFFRTHQAQVVHCHMYRSNIPGTVAGRMARVPVVLGQVHNVDSWNTARQVTLDRLTVGFRAGTIAVSQAVQRDVMRRLHEPEERVPLLYNGIDTEHFRPDSALRAATRETLQLSPREFAFLVPARLHPQKNPLGTVEAFRQLALPSANGLRPVLMFAGGGKMEEELSHAAAGLDGRVMLLGPRDDMAALYNAADAVVLSSLKEGFSNAIVEALACGRPTIASDVGGNREAIDRPEIGWIHPAGNTAELARQMQLALNEGHPGMAAREDACRQRGLEFSIDMLVRNTDQLYRRSLDAARQKKGA